MDNTINDFLQKTIFWQRIAAIVLTIFLLIIGAGYIYYIVLDIYRRPIPSSGPFYAIYFGISAMGGYLLAGFFALWSILSCSQAIKTYLNTQTVTDLEKVFKYQRYFWQTLVLMTVAIVVVVSFFVLLISFEGR